MDEEVWTGSTLQRSDYDPETESSGEKIEIKGFDRFGQYTLNGYRHNSVWFI